ncbi:MAG: hypothetical protein ACE5HN_01755 [Nitrospiria bacterium]
MRKALFFILFLTFSLIGSPFQAEARSESPDQAPTLSEEEEPPKWTDLNGHDKLWWVNRINNWRTKREEARDNLRKSEAAFREIEFKNLSLLEELAEEARLLQEIQEYKKAVAEAEEMIHRTLPEEARKAGAPSGWLR